jgi:hypothetical protein
MVRATGLHYLQISVTPGDYHKHMKHQQSVPLTCVADEEQASTKAVHRRTQAKVLQQQQKTCQQKQQIPMSMQ